MRSHTERQCAPHSRLGHGGGAAGGLRQCDWPIYHGKTARASRWKGNTASGTPQGRSGSAIPAFELYARLCRGYPPEVVRSDLLDFRVLKSRRAARLIWHARPVSYYAWSGPTSSTPNVTQTGRALCRCSMPSPALSICPAAMCCSRPPPAASITGDELPSAKRMGPDIGSHRTPARSGALGIRHHPRSLPGHSWRKKPYPVRGLDRLRRKTCCWAHADGGHGRKSPHGT